MQEIDIEGLTSEELLNLIDNIRSKIKNTETLNLIGFSFNDTFSKNYLKRNNAIAEETYRFMQYMESYTFGIAEDEKCNMIEHKGFKIITCDIKADCVFKVSDLMRELLRVGIECKFTPRSKHIPFKDITLLHSFRKINIKLFFCICNNNYNAEGLHEILNLDCFEFPVLKTLDFKVNHVNNKITFNKYIYNFDKF